mmetsp:Transcript_57603/g.146469  ORF Transcript_57603/g.146469 Transcript_57603/m.146469 type:complete len:239 (-) Transcript_57603:159-875(-)
MLKPACSLLQFQFPAVLKLPAVIMAALRLLGRLSLVAVGVTRAVASEGGLRGWELDHHPWGQGFSLGDGASEANKGDYMDQYIAASGVASKSGGAWWATPADNKASHDDAMSWVHEQMQKQRQHQSLSIDHASGPADDMLGKSFAANVDQPSAGGGGAVVDIKLDSELQERIHAKSRQHGSPVAMLQADAQARSAPNVEDAVAEQRLEDVYIHDPFSAASNADVQEEKKLEASRDFKP